MAHDTRTIISEMREDQEAKNLLTVQGWEEAS